MISSGLLFLNQLSLFRRPANGWDLRAEGWLPAWPQLGGKVMLEQYYGDEVALFGKDSRQKDPYALTAGVSYTPVPLVSFSAEQRQGGSGKHDTRFGVAVTYTPGVSLSAQLAPVVYEGYLRRDGERHHGGTRHPAGDGRAGQGDTDGWLN